MENRNIDEALIRLAKSKFRASFHLNKKMKEYVNTKGMNTLKIHATNLLNERIKPAFPKNDGKQTPMRQVHPVFIAQHACACCCRGCIEKWHKIEKGRQLTQKEIDYLVKLILKWIEKENVQDI